MREHGEDAGTGEEEGRDVEGRQNLSCVSMKGQFIKELLRETEYFAPVLCGLSG